ncbi:MAG: NAD-dependent dehydratase [Chloroflexi bacterium]|nr:NAD-dependent dehydratase [Chloroflexota bacterium]
MRVLVIGGTRFLGPAVVERLAAGGHGVTVFHRGESEHDTPAGVAHLHGDRGELDGFRPDIERLAPDVVLDMAPMSGDDAAAVMRACRGLAPRVAMISSVDVYRAYGRLHGSEPGPLEPLPLTEDAPLREKLYPYRGERGGRLDTYDKIPAERAVMSDADIAGTVLRLPAVHGERDYQHRLFMEVARMDAGRTAILVQQDMLQWRWCRSYAGNVADAIALAATDERAAGRVYNVAEPETLTQEAWLRAVARIAGWEGEIVAAPPDLLPPHLRSPNNYAQDIVADSTRIRRELGYAERVPRDEGIARAIAWERANPPARIDPKWLDFAAEDAALATLRGGGA